MTAGAALVGSAAVVCADVAGYAVVDSGDSCDSARASCRGTVAEAARRSSEPRVGVSSRCTVIEGVGRSSWRRAMWRSAMGRSAVYG